MEAEIATQAQAPEMLLPSDQERKWYYYGLDSHPQLVARSNAATVQWQLRYIDRHQVRKQVSRVGRHPIVDKSETTSLVQDIVDLLEASLGGWQCIDVLRIGESESGHTNPVILWIGVLPNSTSSQLGLDVALRCRAILQRHGVEDVHCEIHEAIVQPASSGRNQPIVKNLDVNVDVISHSGFHFPSFTDTIGQCVAMEADPTREATLCCFVALAKERNAPPEKYAVISRHLVFADDNDNTTYRHHPSSPKKYVIMPGDCAVNEARATAILVLESWTRRLLQLQQRQASSLNEQQRAEAVESVRQYIAKAKRFYDHLVSIGRPETRRIGYVEYSPARQLCARTGNMPDFAVVKLDQARFRARLQDMTNMVYIGDRPDLSALNKGLTWNAYDFPDDGPPFLRLHGVVTTADPTAPWRECGRETISGEMVLRVGKRGGRTSLTWGEVNEFRSVVREGGDGRQVASRHLAVLGFDKTVFSAKGDSGSAIFSPDGKMVAMLDAGREPHQSEPLTGGVTVQDVTYGTPFGWVLDYIRTAGYATAYFC